MHPLPLSKKLWLKLCSHRSDICALALLPFLLLCTCKSKSPTSDPARSENLLSGVEVLVNAGESSQATYSANGERLLFVSVRPQSHRHTQVYEKNLKSGRERRVTYQNGDTYGPRYHPKQAWIAYASSTDELKENSPLLYPKKKSELPFPFAEPFEIYMHSIKELDIIRVSNAAGFDGDLRFHPDGNSLSWTRVTKKGPEVVSWNRQSHATRIIHTPASVHAQWTSSPNMQFQAWLKWDADWKSSQVWYRSQNGPAAEVNEKQTGLKTDVEFSWDSQWLLWAQKNSGDDRYHLWALNTRTGCFKQLTEDHRGPTFGQEERHPTVSPDGKWLTYTVIHGSRSRIVREAFSRTTGTCAPAA